MTNNNGSERLDRMEALLSETIQGLVETRKITEANSRDIAETRRAIAETRESIAETKQITESNARAIQAMVEARATENLKHEQQMQELASIMNRVVTLQDGLGNMMANIDSDRPTILRKLNTIENKVDKLDNLDRIENKIDRIIEEK